MKSYYSAPVHEFLKTPDNEIIGELTLSHQHSLEEKQRRAWAEEILILKDQLKEVPDGHIFLELSIPRVAKRIDVALVYNKMIFVIEFKIDTGTFNNDAINQVRNYALYLKNFHSGTHDLPVVPVLVATRADAKMEKVKWESDFVAEPIKVGKNNLDSIFNISLPQSAPVSDIDILAWQSAGYNLTPTIIESAKMLYRNHKVEEISRSDAGAKNIQITSKCIKKIIEKSKSNGEKSICFVTGSPGSGKTLVGLDIVKGFDQNEQAVFLSGNGPLVEVLHEALAHDHTKRGDITKGEAKIYAESFIQNMYSFRNEYMKNNDAPAERIVVFDEAQRAWSKKKSAKFMKKDPNYDGNDKSEPEFLISLMGRHSGWCTLVCLIGGGQEINDGEPGLAEWLDALDKGFDEWKVYASELLEDKYYTIDSKAKEMLKARYINKTPDLHLSASMRSFRADKLSAFVSLLLDGNADEAKKIFMQIAGQYPIMLTRDINKAREWLKKEASKRDRYGLVASSSAKRLRPEGINIKDEIDSVQWFLNDKDDIRSSYYMEQVATQFDIQGLELDWVGVCWDADLRFCNGNWQFHDFVGKNWRPIKNETKKLYLLNAYRVLLTRARQGMIIFVPQGSKSDPTRPPEFYDQTFQFLQDCGIKTLPTS